MSEPIPFPVTRFRCPHCPRTASSKARTREHIARCWRNPDAKGCKTCKHFDNTYEDYGEDCNVGVDLSGRPACERCGGQNFLPTGEVFRGGRVMAQCPDCGGNGAEVKPGPVVGCEKWEASRGAEA